MDTTELTVTDGIAVLRLDRPKSLNAMNTAMTHELDAALDRCEQDAAIRALVLTGTGRAFCVGSDLKEGSGGDPMDRITHMHAMILRLVHLPKPSVAAINGLALGGGLEIAMACTLRVAAPEARLGLPEVTHALMPAYGGTQLLPRLIGLGRALELALTGEMIPAERAREIGLVNAVAEDYLAAAIALAGRCSASGETAQREIRRAMWDGFDRPLAEALDIEARGANIVANSPEARAGVAAFKKH
jgi:enoyl-CoA hydratase/carnithine racemase